MTRRPVDLLQLEHLSGLTVAAITEAVAGLSLPAPHQATSEQLAELERLADALLADHRAAVRALGLRLGRAAEAGRAERHRVSLLYQTEVALGPSDAVLVAGVDEAGRGPLAGPVVAAAVILRPGVLVPGLDDSKRIPEAVREELYPKVVEAALSVGVGVLGPGPIHRFNILQATYLAMHRALARLDHRPDYVLVDGLGLPGLSLPHRGVIGGDARCASIAAASIVAKVTRDRVMRRVAGRFPGYGFERNKGYATREHWAALDRLGPCPAHRVSFLGRQLGLFTEQAEDSDEVAG